MAKVDGYSSLLHPRLLPPSFLFIKSFHEIWRIKGLAEQEYGPMHPVTKKLNGMHGDAQALLQEKSLQERSGKP